MKILLVSFHPLSKNIYPHLHGVLKVIRNKTELDFFCFPVKKNHILSYQSSPSLFGKIRALTHASMMVAWHFQRLLHYSLFHPIDLILAIDEIAFTSSCFAFPGAAKILWSFDYLPWEKDWARSKANLILNSFTRIFLRKNPFLLIQDEKRLVQFCKSVFPPTHKHRLSPFFLPVGIEGPSRTHLLSSRSHPVLMQMGGIGESRYSSELLQAFQREEANFRLRLHGIMSNDFFEHINHLNKQPNLSRELIQPDELSNLLAQADIGFIGMKETNSNTEPLTFASNQFVHFLKEGIPVIVAGKTDLGKFVEEHRLGSALRDFHDLPNIISEIVENYRELSENSRNCFDRRFDLDLFKTPFLNWLKSAKRAAP